MYINAPGSAQAWTDAMRELPLPLPATDIATDLAFMGYTVLSEDHAVLDRIDDLQHPPPPPPPPPQVSNAPGNQATVPAKSPVVQSASNTPLIAKGQEVKPTDVPSRPPHQAQQTHASALLDRGEQPGMNMNPKRPAPISVGETIHPLPQSSLSSPTQRQPPPISKLRPGDAPSEFNFARSPAGMQPPSAAADNRAQQPPMRHSLPEQPTSLKPGPDLPHSHSKQQRSAPVHPHYREYDLSGPPNWPREAFPQQQQRHPKDDHLGPHSQRPDDFTQPPSSDRIIFGANEPASLGGPRQQQQQSLPSMNLPGGPVKLPPIYTLSPGHQSAP